jgi:hypothetical protein
MNYITMNDRELKAMREGLLAATFAECEMGGAFPVCTATACRIISLPRIVEGITTHGRIVVAYGAVRRGILVPNTFTPSDTVLSIRME